MRLIDADAERLLLANMLGRPEFSKAVLPHLSCECFAIETNRRVFALMAAAADHGAHGVAEVFRHTVDSGKQPEGFSLSFLVDLETSYRIDIEDPSQWIARLKRKAAERRFYQIAEQARVGLETGATDPAEALAATREELRKLEPDFEPETNVGANLGDTFGSGSVSTRFLPSRRA